MTPEAIRAAAELLADVRLRAKRRDRPLDELPRRCRPASLDEAYEIQEVLRELLSRHGLGPQVGWKIGCTTPVMQSYLGIPHPCAGTLYRTTLFDREARLDAAAYFQLGLECEIAVRLGHDLPPRPGGHSAETVAPAAAEVMASVEIVDHRFVDFTQVSTPSLVADDFFSAGCVLGAPRPLGDLGDLATLRGGFAVAGAAPHSHGRGAAILGHPLNALAWLADHLAARGRPLVAGAVVTLGSVVKTLYPGDFSDGPLRVEALFDRLPPVTLEIA